MAQSSLLVHAEAPRRGVLLIGAGIGALFVLYLLNGGSYLPVLAIAGIAAAYVVYKVSAITRIDHQWLILPLVLMALLIKIYFLEGGLRAALHYGLVVLFCAPCVPIMWRAGIFRRGGFELYSIYFGWSLITVAWSLAPEFSLARLADAVMVFCALSAVAWEINQPEEVTRLVERFLMGCGVFLVLLALAGVALPHSISWQLPDPAAGGDSVERFQGLLSNPNDVGVLMLATVGPALAFWSRFEARKKKWIAAIVLLAIGECALADSRTPFIALAIGAVLYVVARYRLRGILAMTAAGAIGIAVLPLFGHSLGEYASRGDVTTLTGRTEMWAYVVQQIRARPIIGYGYQVAGAIFASKYFPIWYGPWDQGPQSSLHNGYLNTAIGLGIPALIFWLFIVLRPWWFALRRDDDPWNLKPLALLVVVPCLIHNLSEASVDDFLSLTGLMFGLAWVIGERYRLLTMEQAEAERQRILEQTPPAVAMFQSMKA